jgi:hypothetical protein
LGAASVLCGFGFAVVVAVGHAASLSPRGDATQEDYPRGPGWRQRVVIRAGL